MITNNLNDTVAFSTEELDEKKEAAAFIDFKMVTFDLVGKDYGIDIMHVKEIAKAGRFTYVPNTAPFVLGVYNLRGEIIPIIDLRIFFNIPVTPHEENKLQNLLILSVEDQIFGLVVDKIDKVIGVQKSTIQPPHPLFGDINIKYIDGVVENNNRLYVLLDVNSIFSINKEKKEEEKQDIKSFYQENKESVQEAKTATLPTNAFVNETVKQDTFASSPVQNSMQTQEVVQPQNESITSSQEVKEETKGAIDIKFIKENLSQYKNFFVSELNESWVKFRSNEWIAQKGESANQLQNEGEAKEFLSSFWSSCTEKWWTKEFKDSVKAILPENSARNIIVWNPGCGKGMETYSLACILKEKYPNAMVKIYAQDVDLLNVSNAALLTVPSELASQWYGPYLTQKANGEYTFSPEIKDTIMFEYHDCKNTNVLPMVDIIFARDVLSLCDKDSQNAIISDFQEKIKGNGIIVVGDNEVIPASFGFGEKSIGDITVYTKD